MQDVKRGFKRILLPRNTSRMQQHSRTHLQSWRANGDVTVILLGSDPDAPDPTELAVVLSYVVGYGYKGVDTMQIKKQASVPMPMCTPHNIMRDNLLFDSKLFATSV
jgi:hypothetical protein